jgi:uncharacterized protein YndB with AHSA1/START domain
MTVDRGIYIENIEGRKAIRFERRFDHSIDRVWAHLTEPELYRNWFAEIERIELRDGGALVARHGGEGVPDMVFNDRILKVQPKTLLEHTFGAGTEGEAAAHVVRWELRPDGQGCALTLTHFFDENDVPRDSAGWHQCFERMEASLEGRPQPFSMDRWSELNRDYGGPGDLDLQAGDPGA